MNKLLTLVLLLLIIFFCSVAYGNHYIGPSFNIYQEEQGSKEPLSYDPNYVKESKYTDIGIGAFWEASFATIFEEQDGGILNNFLLKSNFNVNYNGIPKLMVGVLLKFQFETWDDVYPYLGGGINSSTGGLEWVGTGAVFGINFITSDTTLMFFQARYDFLHLYVGEQGDGKQWDYRRFWTFGTGLGFSL